MKFTNLDHKKNFLEEKIDILNRDIIRLKKEKDTILSEISDQRAWKTIVESKSDTIISWIYDLESYLENLNQLMAREKNNFYKLTDKQKGKVLELNDEITSKLSELHKYNEIELIDKEKENKKIKAWLRDQRDVLDDLNVQIVQLKREMTEFDKYRTKESQKLDKVKSKQDALKVSLSNKSKKLNLKEKRLNKLVLEIKWGKNGKN